MKCFEKTVHDVIAREKFLKGKLVENWRRFHSQDDAPRRKMLSMKRRIVFIIITAFEEHRFLCIFALQRAFAKRKARSDLFAPARRASEAKDRRKVNLISSPFPSNFYRNSRWIQLFSHAAANTKKNDSFLVKKIVYNLGFAEMDERHDSSRCSYRRPHNFYICAATVVFFFGHFKHQVRSILEIKCWILYRYDWDWSARFFLFGVWIENL